MASGWSKVRGGSREKEEGHRENDGSWHNSDMLASGSWLSKGSKREKDGAPDWGARIEGRDVTVDRKGSGSERVGGRSGRNGFTKAASDRLGSRWSDWDGSRGRSNGRNGYSSRSEASCRKGGEGRVQEEDKGRYGRRNREGTRRSSQDWDGGRVGHSRDAARNSSLSRASEEGRLGEGSQAGSDKSAGNRGSHENGRRMNDVVSRSSGPKNDADCKSVAADVATLNAVCEAAVEDGGDRARPGKLGFHAQTQQDGSRPPHQKRKTALLHFSSQSYEEGLENQGRSSSIAHGEVEKSSVQGSSRPGTSTDVNCASASPKGWLYIDQDGDTRGPVPLSELKRCIETHQLMLDHLVRRSGTNEWVTLEHAQSPSDSHSNGGEYVMFHPVRQAQVDQGDENRDSLRSGPLKNLMQLDCSAGGAGSSDEDYQIDSRVEALMRGFPLGPGKEKETVFAALSTASQRWHHDQEMLCVMQESPRSHIGYTDYGDQWKDNEFDGDGLGISTHIIDLQAAEEKAPKPEPITTGEAEMAGPLSTPVVKEDKGQVECVGSCIWPSLGGDWKLVQGNAHFVPGQAETTTHLDKGAPKKVVLNGGRAICDSPNSGLPDPRSLFQGLAIVENFNCGKLEPPQWAVKLWDKKLSGQKPDIGIDDLTHSSHPSSTTPQINGGRTKPLVVPSICQRATPKRGPPNPAKANTSTPGSGQKFLKPEKTTPNRGSVGWKSSKGSGTPKGLPGKADGHLSAFSPAALEGGHHVDSCVGKRKGDEDSSKVGNAKRVKLEGEDMIQSRARLESPLSKAPATFSERSKAVAAGVLPRELLDVKNGEWYCVSGSGLESGPYSYSSVQALVKSGSLPNGSTTYRKSDGTWLSVSNMVSEDILQQPQQSGADGSGSCLPDSVAHFSAGLADGLLEPLSSALCDHSASKGSNWDGAIVDALKFHDRYPQFMSFTRGKLHEHVMRAYKAQVFAAALTEGLDSWLLGKQSGIRVGTANTATSPKLCVPAPAPACSPVIPHDSQSARKSHEPVSTVELVKGSGTYVIHCLPAPETGQADSSFRKQKNVPGQETLEDHPAHHSEAKTTKRQEAYKNNVEHQHSHRRRFIDSGFSEDEEDLQDTVVEDLPAMDNQGGQIADKRKDLINEPSSQANLVHTEHLLEQPEILLKVFRCLNGNVRDLLAAMTTCRTWRAAAEKCKLEMTCADLSSLGDLCTDIMIGDLVSFGGGRLKEVILKGCTSVTPDSLERLLHQCPSISVIDISGCAQLKNLPKKGYSHITWLGFNGDITQYRRREGLQGKMKNSKLAIDKCTSPSQSSQDYSVHSSENPPSKRKAFDADVNSTSPSMQTPVSILDRDMGTNMQSSCDARKRVKLHNGGKGKTGSGQPIVVQHVNGEDGRIHIGHSAEDRRLKTSGKHQSSSVFQRTCPEKLISPTLKCDNNARRSSLSDLGRSMEKEIFLLVKKIKEADPKKFFSRAVSDDKTHGGGMDLSIIEKKLRDGVYSGIKGWDSIKEDIRLLTRQGFREDKGTPKYLAAQAIFRAAAVIQKKVERPLLGSYGESRQKLGRIRKQGNFLINNGRQQIREGTPKGRLGMRKAKDGDGSESDRSHDRESKKLSGKSKKNWSESEAESSDDDAEEEGLFEDEAEEETETDESGCEMTSQSEGEDFSAEDNDFSDYEGFLGEEGPRDWGARMTKASMVPPVTRKYEVIEEYLVVDDLELVQRKMKVELPDDYEQKAWAAQEKRGAEYAHLDIPEVRERKPRKILGVEVVEQEVYGIDPYTHNLLLDTMPDDTEDFGEAQKQQFIEETLLWTLNKMVCPFTGTERAPMEYLLEEVVDKVRRDAQARRDYRLTEFCAGLARNMRIRQSKDKMEPKDRYVAYRKGLGVVCNKSGGFDRDDFVVEFFGEVYPPWRWYEKQDGIRDIQKKDRDQAPEFYNIFLERPKRDAAGYDLLVVDAMYKASFASRLCHSCRPNCEAKVVAVDGRYIIGVFALRPIQCGEELTFDYNSVTESKEEYNSSVCLCGNQGCRGSYLNLAGANTYQEVMRKSHGLLDRHYLLLEACTRPSVTNAELEEMKQAGLGDCLLSGLPEWAVKYTSYVVKYINMEKIKLPDELVKEKSRKRRLLVNDTLSEQERMEAEKCDAEVQTEGVYNQRLQNLAITLDKVRHVLSKLYRQPATAPAPLRRLVGEELVKKIWRGSDAVVTELLQFIDPHVEKKTFQDLRRRVRDHDPGTSGDVERNLRRSLLWLRDELRTLPATCRARHDAAADIIHLYAYTKQFFTCQDYAILQSKPIKIDALDIGPRNCTGVGATYWTKLYNRDYIWGQLIYWFKQTGHPDVNLSKERRGCLMLPDLASCYAKELHHEFKGVYGNRERTEMRTFMEKKPQKQWPKSLWEFKSDRDIFGSPMLDAVILNKELNSEMVKWLRERPTVFVGPWDED